MRVSDEGAVVLDAGFRARTASLFSLLVQRKQTKRKDARRLARNGGQVGLCNVLFEDCSAFTRVTACTLAKSPRTLYTEGFSHFVTSMTAPIASGWSNIAGWDSHPLRNAAFARRTPQQDLHQLLTNLAIRLHI
jgi:hypothetical protein